MTALLSVQKREVDIHWLVRLVETYREWLIHLVMEKRVVAVFPDRSIGHCTWAWSEPHFRHGAQDLDLNAPHFCARHRGVVGNQLGVRGKLGAFYDSSSFHDDAVVTEQLARRKRLLDLDELVKLYDCVFVQNQVEAPRSGINRPVDPPDGSGMRRRGLYSVSAVFLFHAVNSLRDEDTAAFTAR